MTCGPPQAAAARCSDLSSDLPIVGTAPTTSRWWLIEDPGPWGSHALRDAAPPWIAACTEVPTEHARIIFVRRHNVPHHRRDIATRWIFTFAPGESIVWGRQVSDNEDPDIEDFRALPAHPAWAPVVNHPRVTVCTNGSRDRCCAERGRATLAILPPDILDHVWECTHLGGHRFAPVGLAIPSGVVLGRITPDSLIDIVRHERFNLDTVRGRSDLCAPEQVGEVSARRAWDSRSTLDHIRISSDCPTDEATVTVNATGFDGLEHRVSLQPRSEKSVIPSCGATPDTVTVWEEIR